jgi:hypothetical protein
MTGSVTLTVVTEARGGGMKPLIVCVVVLMASACRDPEQVVAVAPGVALPARWANLAKTCDDNSPATTLPSDLRAKIETLPSPFSSSTDAYITRTTEGGWGGRAFRNGDHYDMYFVDTTRTQELFTALHQRGILVPDNLELLQGRWDYAQLYEWASYLNRTSLGTIRGSANIDIPLNRLDITVATEAERLQLDSALSVLDIPCFLPRSRLIHRDPPRALALLTIGLLELAEGRRRL